MPDLSPGEAMTDAGYWTRTLAWFLVYGRQGQADVHRSGWEAEDHILLQCSIDSCEKKCLILILQMKLPKGSLKLVKIAVCGKKTYFLLH